MLVFRLKSTLIPTDHLLWQELVATSLGTEVHPNRALGFSLAREALRNCLTEFNISLPIPQIKLSGYGKIEHLEDLRISLSHSSQWGAAVVGKASDYLSVGIDLEPLERVVKPIILQRISHPQDVNQSPLAIWALKEAIFKAVMNTGQFAAPIEFSSLQIKEKRWIHENSNLNGEWLIEEQEGQLVALAWIRT